MDIKMNQSTSDALVGKCNTPVMLQTTSAGKMGKCTDLSSEIGMDDRWLQICSSFVAVLVRIGHDLLGDLKKWSSDVHIGGPVGLIQKNELVSLKLQKDLMPVLIGGE